MTFAEFTDYSDDKNIGRMEYYKVSPTIADDIKRSSAQAVGGSLLIIVLYILMRFGGMQLGFVWVGALAPNVIIVLVQFSWSSPTLPLCLEVIQTLKAPILP